MQVSGGTITDYYLLNPFVPLGSQGSLRKNGGPYGVVTSSFPLPTTVDVGVNDIAFYSLSFYSAPPPEYGFFEGKVEATYSVQVNNPTTLLLCFTMTTFDVSIYGLQIGGLRDGTETDCYRDNAAGELALVRVTVTVNGVTLTFQ